MPIDLLQLTAELVADLNDLGYKTAPVEVDGYKTTKELTGLLGAMQFENNVAVPQIPKPLDIQALFNVLSDMEIAAIGIEGFGLLDAAVEANDRPRVKRLIKVTWKKGWISEGKHNVIVSSVNETIADPNWLAMIPTKSRLVELAEANGWNEPDGKPTSSITPDDINSAIGRPI